MLTLLLGRLVVGMLVVGMLDWVLLDGVVFVDMFVGRLGLWVLFKLLK
jgi:hypothetical protein